MILQAMPKHCQMVPRAQKNDQHANADRNSGKTSTIKSVSPLSGHVSPATTLTYGARMLDDSRWALSQGSRFFEGGGDVQKTLHKITAQLNSLNLPYTVVGGMALFMHGFRRFTEDVDILVTAPVLKDIHAKLEGLGYAPLFQGSKNLRDTETGVKIEFLVTGGFPGDGKPKPVAFPDPVDVGEIKDGICILSLPALIELKLASGMSGSDRLKDLSDVQELIKNLELSEDFAEQLNPYVREKYAELFRSSRRRFVRKWQNESLAPDAQSLPEIAVTREARAAEMRAMLEDGVLVEAVAPTAKDYTLLSTTDPKIAAKYDMHEESEFWETE